MNLPLNFTRAMQALLGSEYEEYLKSYENERVYGLRVNTKKISVEEFLKITPFNLKPIPWVDNGFFYDGTQTVTKHPHYHAGLYYIQEPSAMIPASRLPISPNDTVLDLCGAPGGKATELGARLNGTGLLVANDISNSRAKGLLKNLELFGIPNLFVTSEAPGKLLQYFPDFFDKILIDAPCSGEGMFRKDPSMIKSWLEHGPQYYGEIQREILLTAAEMLKCGGMILYSTCTFSPVENESTIQYLLDSRKDFELISMKGYEGFSPGRWDAAEGGSKSLQECVRVWPHKMQGEGHFAALLKKKENGNEEHKFENSPKSSKMPKECEDFLNEWLKLDLKDAQITVYDNKVYALPKVLPPIKGLRFLRTGLYLGEVRKNRFEPSQALASSLSMSQAKQAISFSGKDERVIRYLKGETVELSETETVSLKNGWILVCTDGYSLGFAKLANGTLKNKYYAGWRMQ